ncbi:MAG: hypothetical protein QM802_18495 [Agriterribacter sp.]
MKKKNFEIVPYRSFYDSVHQTESRNYKSKIDELVTIIFDHKKNKALRIECDGYGTFSNIKKTIIKTGSKDVTKSVRPRQSEYIKSFSVFQYNGFIIEFVAAGAWPESTMCVVELEDISDYKDFVE